MKHKLAKYKWYRKRKGGIWHKVRVTIPDFWVFWTNENPSSVEDILKTEDYVTLKIPLHLS